MRGNLSRQQELWAAGTAMIRAFRPALLYLLLPSALMGIGMFFGKRTAGEVAAESGSFYYAVGALFCLWLFLKRRRSRVLEEVVLFVPEAEEGKRKILLLASMGLCAAVGISALLTLLSGPARLWDDYRSSAAGGIGGYDRILVFITYILLSPVMEELVFRGFMIRRLETWFTGRQAVLISTAFFALCHADPVWSLYAFAMGLILAWIARREENIFYSMVFHVGFNLSALPVSLINGSEFCRQLLFGSRWKVGAAGIAAAAAAVFLCRSYIKEETLYD